MRNYLLITLLILFTFAACTEEKEAQNETTPEVSPTPGATVQINVFGLGVTSDLINSVASGFENDLPGYDVDNLGGSEINEGVMGLAEDAAQVIGMTRPPTEDELELVPDLVYVELGQAGIALFTREDVGVENLTEDQAKAILSGEITNWSDAGGPDQPIRLFVRSENAWPTQLLRERLIGETPFPNSASVHTSPSLLVNSVESTPYSVGYDLWSSVVFSGAKVVPISLDGIAPTDPDYPLLTSVGIGYREKNQAEMDPLLAWLNSEEGQSMMTQFGVIIKN